MSWFLTTALAFLLGSIPFSYLAVRAWTGRDIREVGSRNVGTTNALRAAGVGAALLALVLDVGKGVGAVLLAQHWTGAPAAGGLAGVAAVLGHVRPVFLRSGGGKGGATGFGALVALAPAAGVMAIAVLALVIAATRYVSVGTMTTAAVAPGLVLLAEWLGWGGRTGPWPPLAVAAIGATILVRHAPNLRRLRAGVEPRLTRPGPAPADPATPKHSA